MEFHLERWRAVSSNICTFVLVYAINRLPAQMWRARTFTHSLGVFMWALMTLLFVRTQGNPKEIRTLWQGGEGLCADLDDLESQVSQMNEAIKKEPFVLWTHSLDWVCFVLDLDDLRKSQSRCCMTLPTHPASLWPGLCGSSWTMVGWSHFM